MNVTSNWRITLFPGPSAREILSYGQEIAAEPTFALRKGLEVIPLVDAFSPFLRPSRNTVFSMNFTAFADDALDSGARMGMLLHLYDFRDLPAGPLAVEISGITDRYWQWQDAFVTEVAATRFIEAGTARIARSYSITATNFGLIVP